MALAVAGEWVRTSWTYQPVTLSHTGSTIVKALHSALTQAGWELSTWSGTGDDRYYLRKDRRFLNVTNDANGTAGNVAMSKNGANINVSGMAGGSVSAKATGNIELVAQPADGNTISISDGTTTVVFEFDSNSSVTGGNIAVTIGTKIINTIDNLMAAINAHAFNVTASLVSDLWRYNGDAVEQNCGIHVLWASGNSRVEVSAFLENISGNASMVETTTNGISVNQKILVAYNQSVPNEWLIYCGEDGLYMEVGISGSPQSIAHGMIATFAAMPEFSGTKDAQRKLSSQGLCMDLFGSLKFSLNRNFRLVDNAGSNKNYTGTLKPFVARGVENFLAPTPANAASHYIAPLDNLIGVTGGNASTNQQYWWCAFGVIYSPVDDRYKVSPIIMLQHTATLNGGVNSGSVSNNVVADGATWMTETRWLRRVRRLAACDGSLLPFNNITDSVFNIVYRVTRVADGGRNANLAIEYPSATVTVPTTPSV